MKNVMKVGMLGFGMCMMMAVMMSMPVSAVSGHYEQVSIFSDNFDERETVDFDEWGTQGSEDDFTIDYQAMNLSWDVADRNPMTEYANWSWGIYNENDITNDTVFSNNDIYVQAAGGDVFEFWDGIIDDENIGTNMTVYNVGQVGVVFYHSGSEPLSMMPSSGICSTPNPSIMVGVDDGIYAWYVDTADNVQLKAIEVDLNVSRWYEVEITYTPENKEATINVTDTVNGVSDSVDVTKIRAPEGELRQFFFGWLLGGAFGIERGEVLAPIFYMPVAFIDNVDIYAYEFVPTTTPVVPTLPTYQDQWGVTFMAIGAVGLLFSVIVAQDLAIYAGSVGYANTYAIAAIPIAVFGSIAAIGAAIYYGYIPYTFPKLW